MYRAAVIGLGKIGLTYDFEPVRPRPSSHVSAYEMSPEFQLVCGIDPDERKAAMLHKVNPDIRFFRSMEEALAHGALDAVDIVSVCTPPELHLPLLEQLLLQRICRVIFCEKPLVRDAGEKEHLLRLLDVRRDCVLVPNISRRWNTGAQEAAAVIQSGNYGKLQKIHVRYTRGIYNTGSHFFDLLHMWTGTVIQSVLTLGACPTSAEPEASYSFYFAQENGVTGYAEAVDDRNYYLFELDLYFTEGKVEMRSSGDEIRYYRPGPHHLFEGFRELELDRACTGLLAESCLARSLENINGILEGNEFPACSVMDAIYPLRAAAAVERSWRTKQWEEIGE